MKKSCRSLRLASLNNHEIGGLFGVGYSTDSQNRKRSLEKAEKNEQKKSSLNQVETTLSKIKI